MLKSYISKSVVTLVSFSLLSACGGNSSTDSTAIEPSAFSLNFKVVNDTSSVNCDTEAENIGPNNEYTIGIADMRFYVSNIKFRDVNGSEIALSLDDNDFQLNHEAGTVALIDFTSADSGFCELATTGTLRTNTQITGMVDDVDAISSVSFDVGVPQALMKAVIAATDDVTDTPSPLGEMYWSWASGYRHFVLNFVTMTSDNTSMVVNSGFHIGSLDCGTTGKALSEQDECGLLNTPAVYLETFDPEENTITVDLAEMFNNIQTADVISDVWSEYGDDDSVCIDDRRDGDTCVTGENIGVQCHSGAAQTACVSLFPNFGLDITTGEADDVTNMVFGME